MQYSLLWIGKWFAPTYYPPIIHDVPNVAIKSNLWSKHYEDHVDLPLQWL